MSSWVNGDCLVKELVDLDFISRRNYLLIGAIR